MIEKALYYLSKGFSVIPINEKSKTPAISSWKEFQNRKPTEKELHLWFSNGNKRNIGIVTGRISGLAVVDLDSDKAVEFAKDNKFPQTPFSKTGKGYQAYYRFKEGTRNFQKRDDLPDIDLRAEGGYVVAPPSIHPNGKQYQWAGGKGLDDLPLSELPEIILANDSSHRKSFKEIANGVSHGSRDMDLTRLVGKWFSLDYTHDECLSEALRVNERNNPPLPERKVKKIVDSIYRADQRNKKQITKESRIVSKVTDVTEVTVFPLIEFPLDVFPTDIQRTIKKISASFHVQDEVIACPMLPIISSAIGNTIKISPKEGWIVPVFIWLILIALTGYGKSPIINILMKELERMQGEAYQEYKTALKEYKRLLRQSKDNSDIDVPDKPALKHYLVSDFTIESLSGIFHDDPRGVIAYIDEIAGLINGLNQYKGKGNDRQHILNLWNAASWMIDRKTEAMFIPNTGASIIGGIQPRVIPQVFSLDSFDDGFLPRFLFYQATSGKNRFNRQSISESDLHSWNELIRYCFRIPLEIGADGFAVAKILKLDDNALDIFESFYNEYMAIEPFLSDRARAFIPKLITYCLKFAGVLHVMQSYSKNISIDRPIDSNTTNNAIRLTRFFTGQAIRILKLYDPEEPKYNEYEKRLMKSLYTLQGEVQNAKLPLSRVVDTFNADLPKQLHHTPEKVKSLLTGLNINTAKSTHNYSYLIWESDVLNSLFLQNTITTVTTVTPNNETEEKKVTEVTDVTVKHKKQTLLEDDDNVLDLTGHFGGAE